MRDAIIRQLQVAALLLVFCGLTIAVTLGAGPFLDTGLSALAPLLLPPAVLSIAATRRGSYRIASVLSALGAAAAAFGFWLLISALPGAVLGFGIGAIVEGATLATILIAATRLSSAACETLWHADAPAALPAPLTKAQQLSS